MSEDLTGRRLGHYKIDSVLGRGGMSVLYRATDVRLGRKVALKVMGDHITGDSEFRERFVDEARNTSAIDHANIVPLYDFGEVDGMLYIAMRLVEGSDLASLIKDSPISPRRALELLGQVAEALDMLHERGLVHLDLKPANVLVTSRESAHEHVYLADFGLTRRGATGHRTSGGDFLGSPTYAAPEHLRGEPVDGRTDLYALTCMLFACLTGGAPYRGQVQDVIQGHLSGEPPSAAARVALPPALDAVLRRGMSKRADERYDTCRQMIAAGKAAWDSASGPTSGPLPAQGPNSGPFPAQGPNSGPFAAQGSASGPQPGPPPQPVQPGLPPQPPRNLGPPGQTPPQQTPPQQVPPHQERPAPGQSGPHSGPAARQSSFPEPTSFPPQQPRSPDASEPVRLRPPMPAQPSSFATRSSSPLRWVVPLLIAVVAIVLVVVVVVVSGSSGGHRGTGSPASHHGAHAALPGRR